MAADGAADGAAAGCAADGGGPTRGLADAFDEQAARHGGRPAAEDGTEAWSYAQLQEASRRLSHALAAHAPAPGAAAPVVAVLMHRSCAWVASCLAAARLGWPVLALSADLGSEAEAARNRGALRAHRPPLLLVDAASRCAASEALSAAAPGAVDGDLEAPLLVDVGDLLRAKVFSEAPPQSCGRAPGPDAPLYLVYTGGTTSASKCVVVTHRMALHELAAYPEVAPLKSTDRVLHQSSAYWGATSLGIFKLAWACAGCLVLTEAGAGPAEVSRAVGALDITVAGLVPSVLEVLEPDRCRSLRIVFTWGEFLPLATAQRWSNRVALFDLLIASEYWLAVVADYRTLGTAGCDQRPGFKPVRGASVTLRPPVAEDEATAHEDHRATGLEQVANGEVGELFLAGPMVSNLGYSDHSLDAGAFVDLPVASAELGGPSPARVRHFRTRDLARMLADGSLEYCGRADGFAKVGGKWVDLTAVEQRLLAAGCREAAVVWDAGSKQRHAAVVLADGYAVPGSLATWVRNLAQLLPEGTRLHVLPELPHHAATGKVLRADLARQLAVSATALAPKGGPVTLPAKRSLAFGLLLSAIAGVPEDLLLPLAFALAPGLTSRSARGPLGLLPSVFGSEVRRWVACWRACVRFLAKFAALRALPFVFLLLLDAASVGLGAYADFLEGPFGCLGTALLICRGTTPWLLSVLAAGGRAHAAASRGGASWAWAFWLSFPYLESRWKIARWKAFQDHATSSDAALAVRGVMAFLSRLNSKTLPKLRRCEKCWEWAPEASVSLFREASYCGPCTAVWDQVVGSSESKPTARKRKASDHEEKEPGTTNNSAVSISGQADNNEVGTSRDSPWVCRPAWRPGLDEVNFTAYDVECARACLRGGEAAGNAPSLSAATSEVLPSTSRVGQIVEDCTGLQVSNSAVSLAGLESLKLIALVSALRRRLAVDLAVSEVAACNHLADLEDLCAQAAPPTRSTAAARRGVQASKGVDGGQDGTWAFFAIPRFWKAPVAWLVRLSDVPDESAMRVACRALVRRHAALRAVPCPRSDNEELMEACNSAAAILVAVRRLLPARGGDHVIARASQGLLAAWPRASAALDPRGPEDSRPAVAHFSCQRFPDEAALKHAAWNRARTRGFQPPVSVALLVLSPATTAATASAAGTAPAATATETAFLHVAVNHAVCDAACIVPLVTDLLALHRVARSGMAGTLWANAQTAAAVGAVDEDARAVAAVAAADLPPVANGLAVQAARLQSTLAGGSDGAESLDLLHTFLSPVSRGYDHYVRLLPSACEMLEVGAAAVGTSQELLLVAAIVIAFGQCSGQAIVKLTILVPMRDSCGEDSLVGNLVTTRHLRLQVLNRPVFAVALDLTQRVRARDWSLCEALEEDGDRIFVNVHGMPRFDCGAVPVVEPVNTKRQGTKCVRHMVEVLAAQDASDVWHLWMGVRNDLNGSAIARGLRDTLWSLAAEPLSRTSALQPAAAPNVVRLAIDPASSLSQRGLPRETLAIEYSRYFQSAFSAARCILEGLVGDLDAEVAFEDDPEWTTHPEVGAAIAAAGGRQGSYALAVCHRRRAWAVGVGTGWKGRAQAAELGLSLVLAQGTAAIDELGRLHPDLPAICARAGCRDPY